MSDAAATLTQDRQRLELSALSAPAVIFTVAMIAFPVVYTVASLVRGALSHLYPYPFIDVAALGYQRVLGNMALDRVMRRRS